MKCWCGDDHEPTCPTCDTCGAPVQTGLMAAFCPRRMQCEFYIPEALPFLNEFWRDIDQRSQVTSTGEPSK